MFNFKKKKYYMLDDKEPKITFDYNGEVINLFNVDIKPSRANKETLVKFVDYMSITSTDNPTKTFDGIGFLKRYDDAYSLIKNSLDADTKKLLDIQGIMSRKSGYEPEKIRNLISVAYRSLNKVKNDITNIEGRELVFTNDEYTIEKLTTPQAVISFSNGDCWCCICGVNLSTGEPCYDQVASARSAMVSNDSIGTDSEGKVIKGDYYGFHNKNTGKKYFFQYKEGYPNNYKVWSQRDKKLFEKMGENSQISMSNTYAPQALEFLRGLKDIDHLGSINVNFKELYDVAMDKDKKEQLFRETSLAGYGAQELEVIQEMTEEEKKEAKRRKILREIQLIENEFEDRLEFSIIGNLISVHLSLKGSYKAKNELNQIFQFDGSTIVINENNLVDLGRFVGKLKELANQEPDVIADPDEEGLEHTEVPFELESLTFIIHFGDILRYVDTSKMSEAELKYIKRRDEDRVVTGRENILKMLDALVKSPNLLRFNSGYSRLAKDLTSIGIFTSTKFKEKEWYDDNNHQAIADSMNELIDKKLKDVYGKGMNRDTNFSRIVNGINRVLGKPLEFKIPTIKEDNMKYDAIIKDYNVVRTRGGYLTSTCLTTYITKNENGEKLNADDIKKITQDALNKYPNDTYAQKVELITPEQNDNKMATINESEENVDPNLYSEDNQDIANSNMFISIDQANEDSAASSVEWVNSKTNYIDLKSITNLLIKNDIVTCKQALDFFNEIGVDEIKVGKKNSPLNQGVKDMLKASIEALNQKFSNTEQEENQVEEEPEIIEEEQESNEENNETITREQILEETQGRAFEFDNGDVYGVDFDEENQILFAGSISNSGVSKDVEIEYDNDKSIGGNLEALYQKCIEENPDLLNEEEPEVIEEENEEQEASEVSNAPTKETHDGGVLSLNENGDIQITYPGNENEAETSYVVIDLETYANTDELTIVPENFHEMVDELVRQCDLDDFEAQEYCERVLSYLNIVMDWEDEEDVPNEEEE